MTSFWTEEITVTRSCVLPALAVALLLACGGDRNGVESSRGTPARDVGPITRVVLADSVLYSNELVGDSAVLRRVAVRVGGRADTLSDVLTAKEPLLVGDSVVYGFLYHENEVVAGFSYRPGRGVERLPFPRELQSTAIPELAPDGRHLAYLVADSGGYAHPEVVAWPSGELVLRGPSVRMLETDAGVDEVNWVSPTELEFLVRLSHAVGGTMRLRADLQRGTTNVDTIPRRTSRRKS